MTSFSFIKKSPHSHLLHLYEHAVCIQLHALLRKKGYFCYVDYALKGRTFDDGFTLITVEVYTPEVATLVENINNVDLNLNDTVLSLAFYQLLAEEQALFSFTKKTTLIDAVAELHSQPWVNIEDLTFLQLGDNSFVEDIFTIEADITTDVYTGTIILDKRFIAANPTILPLFRQIALVVGHNLQMHVSNTKGYYRQDLKFKDHKLTFKNRIVSPLGEKVDLDKDGQEPIKIIDELKTNSTFDRLLQQLSEVSLMQDESMYPDIEQNYKETSILIGTKGWQSLTSDFNLQDIFENTQLSLHFKDEEFITDLK